ncbi:high-affinity phosphate transport protein (ABC superfamily, membrane) [Candidatus Competibacter denitrificans Run_A_D11]|uniref:Phosphate transport system permease protein PstA n=1 Tax=Candidatus Competibacter denitrificans Run_A_D11 TaxID=1400863 RepID=W6MAY7_9GAMM|nr:phosphate ABC transporter permease PstA [Candidatus Competibacter denitrificans]CDI03175.1 high-affinity phosphate transport protein (ABC superfamily, membrane) [Candidatus Competibacter denitrificans Run_A_D11]HAS87196.1 phosphate ABC transporter permease PtsA [Candidatus Competibacteraceae bacterium]HRC70888.1 phosphate ABC transporter permease PstA [Candidatus Competibacter denitrificans]
MNKPATGSATPPPSRNIKAIVHQNLARRRAAERRFRGYGLVAITLGLAFVVLMFGNIISKGLPAFWQTYIQVPITFDSTVLDPQGARDPQALANADYATLVRAGMRQLFPHVEGRLPLRALGGLISSDAAYELQRRIQDQPELLGSTQEVWLLASAAVDTFFKGNIDRTLPEAERPIKDNQIEWLDKLKTSGKIEKQFNAVLFQSGDSREPEQAGIRGALMGSFFTLLVTFLLSFPIGVATAVYLEEFAPKNRWTDIIEVNINNLAAVPSIVFGLLGLAVFINFFGLPRSAPLVGGLVLSLMTLPVIIIAGRAALTSVPPSIREAALGMGASKLQMVGHHVLPLAMPGMLTGSIIGMARALGESAPLLMIGMVAFIVDVPKNFLDPATVLPVQIYLWSDLPERAFVERTSAAIMVLLAFMILMNGLAILLRKRFERRW